ncbi:MAG: methyltransferase family protein [Erythrobacter sp.]
MSRFLILAYAAAAYVLSLASLVYIVGFIADIGVPKAISDGERLSVWAAVAIDVGLIALFGLHHSITARSSFKRWWTRIFPAPIERATYLYMTAINVSVLVYSWKPIPITIWRVESHLLEGLILAAYAGVWVMMVAATFHFGHFRFLGLAQAWENFRQKRPERRAMSARYLYVLVRHPISLGWMLAPFFVAHFTIGHLVFAVATMVYVLLATPFEEADLIDEIGEPYREYRTRVPAFIPFSGKPRSLSGSRHT